MSGPTRGPNTSGPDDGSGGGRPTLVTSEPRERWLRVVTALGSLQGYIGLVLVVAAGIITKGDVFLSQGNLTNAVGAFASRGILAIGETLVILAAGIDLSVASMLALSSMASAMMLAKADMSPFLILPLCMAVGAAMGFVNGAGTTWLRIQPFVMTLATLSIFRGLDKEISNNVSVGTEIVNESGELTPHSAQFQFFGTPGSNLFEGVLGEGVYYPVLAFALVAIVFHLILTKTTFGRHVYAVGGNETAARLSGVNVAAVKIAVFTLCGMLAGFAGPIDAAYSSQADPRAGQMYELDAIAAAVIGGARLQGGRGSMVGTFVGALILTLLDNILGLNAVSANMQLIIKGSIVVLAVVLQRPDFLSSAAATVRRLIRPAAS